MSMCCLDKVVCAAYVTAGRASIALFRGAVLRTGVDICPVGWREGHGEGVEDTEATCAGAEWWGLGKG